MPKENELIRLDGTRGRAGLAGGETLRVQGEPIKGLKKANWVIIIIIIITFFLHGPLSSFLSLLFFFEQEAEQTWRAGERETLERFALNPVKAYSY